MSISRYICLVIYDNRNRIAVLAREPDFSRSQASLSRCRSAWNQQSAFIRKERLIGLTGFNALINNHSSLLTSVLNDDCFSYVSERSGHGVKRAYLQDVNARPCYMAKQFVLIVKVSSKHLRRLVDRMFDFDRNTTSSLRFFDDLDRSSCEPGSEMSAKKFLFTSIGL